ncbi:MAG: DUF2188 domain-containing protein [Acidobacteriota bacterium]
MIPSNGRWVIRGNGRHLHVYKNKTEAVAAARSIAKERRPSQVVVHRTDGRIESEAYGLPAIQDPPYSSKLGAKRIEKAVSAVVRSRAAKGKG